MIYVDLPREQYMGHASAQTRRNGSTWSHLWCDAGDEAALHQLAARIGLKREWYQDKVNPRYPHYDCVPSKRLLAVEAGATPMEFRDWLRHRWSGDEAMGDAPLETDESSCMASLFGLGGAL